MREQSSLQHSSTAPVKCGSPVLRHRISRRPMRRLGAARPTTDAAACASGVDSGRQDAHTCSDWGRIDRQSRIEGAARRPTTPANGQTAALHVAPRSSDCRCELRGEQSHQCGVPSDSVTLLVGASRNPTGPSAAGHERRTSLRRGRSRSRPTPLPFHRCDRSDRSVRSSLNRFKRAAANSHPSAALFVVHSMKALIPTPQTVFTSSPRRRPPPLSFLL